MQERGNPAGEYSHDTGRRIARYAFVYALLVSVLLHLFSIYSVRIYVKPAAINKGASSNISFLGSILEEGPIVAGKIAGKSVSDTGIGRKRSLELSEVLAAENADVTNEEKPVFAADFDILEDQGGIRRDDRSKTDAPADARYNKGFIQGLSLTDQRAGQVQRDSL